MKIFAALVLAALVDSPLLIKESLIDSYCAGISDSWILGIGGVVVSASIGVSVGSASVLASL